MTPFDSHVLIRIRISMTFTLIHARCAYASSNGWLRDGGRIESDGRLGEDAAVERGAGFEGA